jgi:hypothetical protein
MDAQCLSRGKERGILLVSEQYLRPLHAARRLVSRPRNACEPSNLFGSHRQLDRLAPSCHDVTPRLIKHKRGIHERVTGFHDCLFHGIGRLVVAHPGSSGTPQTAKALGLTIPAKLHALADEVIE